MRKKTSSSLGCERFGTFKEKKIQLSILATMLCMGDTLGEEEVLMIFDELEVQNSPNNENLVLMKTTVSQNLMSD